MQIKKIFGYYWPHIKAYKWSFTAPFVLYGFATTINHVWTPIIYKEVIDTITTYTNTPVDAVSTLSGLLLLLVVAIVLTNIFYRSADYVLVYVQSKIMKDTEDEAFTRLQAHSQSFFANSFGGSLVAKAKRYTDSFMTLHDLSIFNIWMNGLVLVGISASLIWFAPVIAGLFVVWLAIFIIVTIFFMKYKIPRDLRRAETQSLTTGALADVVANVMNVKMFARRLQEGSTFAEVTNSEEVARRAAWRFEMHQFVAQGILVGGFEILVMVIAVHLWVVGTITAGTILLLQTYLLNLFNMVWSLGRNMSRVMRALADAQEMIDIFETPVEVQDPKMPEECKITVGAIEIDHINYSYHSEEEKGEAIFDDFSLSIRAGERVGLVGHSGSGKTTITKLILRFMDVDGGEIRIDGQNIAKITQDDLRKHISYVPQDPILFHRSLRENIAYGKSGASEQEIVAAAKAANAHEFISTLPDGYDTLVGERGVKLSGGERQRVAIARAMLKDAPILILDEATSALDSISEKHIQEAFERLMQGRTTIAIAHRLSTVQKMDRIVVFESGVIAEEGTHKELTERDGIYAALWHEQSSGFIE